MGVSKKSVDFTKVKEAGGVFNKKRHPEGDYLAKVTKVTDAAAKKDGEFQWLFTVELQQKTGTYPYYCKLVENQLWKLRNLLVAAGLNVPKKRVQVDPTKIVNKLIGITLEDDEYEGKLQSNIAAVFPAAELDQSDSENDEEEDEEDEEAETEEEEEEEEEEAEPAPPAKKKRSKKAAPVDDDELEELEIEEL